MISWLDNYEGDMDIYLTDEDGTLVSSSSSEEEIVTIPIGTYGVFEKFGPNGEIAVRFEIGPGKVLTFMTREGQPNGKYFIIADWKASPAKGGKIENVQIK